MSALYQPGGQLSTVEKGAGVWCRGGWHPIQSFPVWVSMVLNLLFLAILTCQTGMSGGQPPLGATSRSRLQTVLSGYKMEPWFDVNDEPRWAQTKWQGTAFTCGHCQAHFYVWSPGLTTEEGTTETLSVYLESSFSDVVGHTLWHTTLLKHLLSSLRG